MERFKNFIDTTMTNVDESTKFIVEDEETHETHATSIHELLLFKSFVLNDNKVIRELNDGLARTVHYWQNQCYDYEDMLDGCVDGAEICKCAVCRDYFYVEDCTHKDEWGKPICDDCYDKTYKGRD